MKNSFTYGLENEYSIVDAQWNPQADLDGEHMFNVVMQELQSPKYKDFKGHGRFVPEVLSHMIEFNTKKWSLSEIEEHAVVLHQIVEEIIGGLWLVLSDEQPATPSQYIYPTATAPKNFNNKQDYPGELLTGYFKEGIDIYENEEPGLGYLAGTTSTHMHFSTGDNELNFKLWGALAKKVSREIRENPKLWYKKYGMSDARYHAWSKLVEKRKLLIWDVVWNLDEVFTLNGNYREFLLERFFSKNGKIIDPRSENYKLLPNKDHWGYSIKQPEEWIYTVESRLPDSWGGNWLLIPWIVWSTNDILMETLGKIQQ